FGLARNTPTAPTTNSGALPGPRSNIARANKLCDSQRPVVSSKLSSSTTRSFKVSFMTIPGHSLYVSATVGSRRKFILTRPSLPAAAACSSRALGVVKQNVKLSEQPFQLGVAAGDPSSDGFVIWTRLAPKPLEGGGMPTDAVEVAWQVAEDEGLKKVIKKGT